MTDEGDGGTPVFDVTRRGYRTEQVNAWVGQASQQIDALRRELDQTRQLARSLQTSLDEARAREQSAPETFGVRAEKVLRLAEHDARVRRERAEQEAEEIRELAHFEAERTVADARTEAARTREAAEQAAARVRDDADAAAERARAEVADARRDADMCADTAASMHEHVRTLRGAVRGELARLHAALGAELRELDAPPDTSRQPAADRSGAGASGDGHPNPDRDRDTDTDTDRGRVSVARVVALPEQRDRPPREDANAPADHPSVPAAAGD